MARGSLGEVQRVLSIHGNFQMRTYSHSDSPDHTQAIQGLIDEIAAEGGGALRIAPGRYRVGPLRLCSHLHLHLETGAELRFIPEFDRYTPVFTRWEGGECQGYMPCVYGHNLEDIQITGHGLLHGGGDAWWAEKDRRGKESLLTPLTDPEKRMAVANGGYEGVGSGGGGRETGFLRPPLIQLIGCTGVTLKDFTATHSPFWYTHLVYCEDVDISGVRIKNPKTAPNGDGLSLDSCRFARVTNCHIDAGDDCLTLKSGIDADGRRVARPVELVTISNCTFANGHGGVVFGSEISGGVQNIVISNCVFSNTDRGIRMKARRGRGGFVRGIRCSNVIMDNVFSPLVINSYYKCGARADDPVFSQLEQEVSELTPYFADISISGLQATECKASLGLILGLPQAPVTGLTLSDCSFHAAPDAPGGKDAMIHGRKRKVGEGLEIQHARRVRLNNVTLTTNNGPALKSADVHGEQNQLTTIGSMPDVETDCLWE